MFKRKKQGQELPPDVQKQEITIDVKELDSHIYTMPENFHHRKFAPVPRGTSTPTAVDKKPKIIGLIIMIVAGGGIIVGAVLLYLMSFGGESQLVVNQNVALINQNQNVNQNINANINRNTNTSREAAINQNINTSRNTNTSREAAINQNINTSQSAAYSSSRDSDKDNLTDVEEELYGTDLELNDSDNDTYLDGQEILNLYNPLGSGYLEDSELVRRYDNTTFNYSILYPTSLIIKVIDSESREVIFSATNGEFVEVLIQENPEKLTASQWYLKQSPGTRESSLEQITVNDLQGVVSPDQLSVYLVKDDLVYILIYNIGTRASLNFKSTFEMMLRSFIVNV